MIENDGKQWEPNSLEGIRIKLNQMTERITSRLKDRSLFSQNNPIYEPDEINIANHNGVSLLQFAIEGIENYHASLGRYNYNDQFPVLDVKLPTSSVERIINKSSLYKLDINIGESILPFYHGLIKKYCEPKNDPTTYGETAYLDADIIQIINERINIGRYVADIKIRNDPTIYEIKDDKESLLLKIKDKKREEILIEKVRSVAQRYELNPDMAEEMFRWMIECTINVEIAYIQQIDKNTDFIKVR
jgi:chorismate mutase